MQDTSFKKVCLLVPSLLVPSLLVSSLLAFHCCSAAFSAEPNRTVTISGNEEFELLQGKSVTFEFKPLPSNARALEGTNDASSLGVAHLGQLRLKENTTALAALRSMANQIGKSLDLKFSIVADSSTSEALRENELLLLYHPDVVITLTLAKPIEQDHYEIICTYAVREIEPGAPVGLENPDPVQAQVLPDRETSVPAEPDDHPPD